MKFSLHLTSNNKNNIQFLGIRLRSDRSQIVYRYLTTPQFLSDECWDFLEMNQAVPLPKLQIINYYSMKIPRNIIFKVTHNNSTTRPLSVCNKNYIKIKRAQ